MQKIIYALLILSAGAALASPAGAQGAPSPTLANDILEQYDQGDASTRLEIEDSLLGVQEGFRVANLELQLRGQRFLYCQPPGLILNGGQLVSMVRQGVASDITLGAREFGVALLMVDRTTFPCR
jgi:hypothetical protein